MGKTINERDEDYSKIFMPEDDLQSMDNSKALMEASFSAVLTSREKGFQPKQALKALCPNTEIQLDWVEKINWLDAVVLLYLETKCASNSRELFR